MASSHDEIKEKLPGYIKAGLLPDEVKEHLAACNDCKEEVLLLKTLNRDVVPEPGGMFFETLPRKVKASIHEEKRNILFRFAPAFILIFLIAAAGYIYHSVNVQETDELYVFSDPLDPPAYDLEPLRTEDVPLITETIEGDEVLFDESTFLAEFAYLSSEEIDKLFDELNIKKSNGGVL